MEALTLYELNSLVRQVLEAELSHEYWVEAELAEARESRGHCYMELVEKDDTSNTPIARASAKCWRTQWSIIQPHFERITGQPLHAGLKVRLKVYAQFHEAFGFSWIVTDIDPTFTLGDMARRRQEILRQLKEEGVFDLQRELTLPLFCLRIAVISSATAAGYGDFCKQLEESGFAFQTQLFPAIMQGEQVEESIIAALEEVYRGDGEDRSDRANGTYRTNGTYETYSFDCVVIIRGGGATADMSGFDTLALAENVANFPLPIITGIGHDRDECVLDMVSHLRVKTPTAAAAFLIDHVQQIMDRLNQFEERLAYSAQARISNPLTQLSLLTNQFSNLIDRRMLTERHKLEMLEQRAASLDPQLILKRGYSITLHNGKAVRSAQQLKANDEIETKLEQGTVISKVEK